MELFKSNTPIDEKRISRIETIVSRLARRSKKHTSIVTPPYPISSCVLGDDVKGNVLNYMFCARGVISRCLISFNKNPSTGIKVNITLSNDLGGSSKSFIVARKTFITDPNIEVYSGDKLSISIEPVDEKDVISEVWISFMWTPNLKEAETKKILIDSLDGGLSDLLTK